MKCSTGCFRNLITQLLTLAVLLAGSATAQSPRALSSAARIDPNTVLLSAASPFEDITEFALDGNLAGIDRTLQAYSRQSARVDGVLSTTQRVRLHARTAAIAKTRRTADFAGVAMNAVEAYGILVQALQPRTMKVPVEVARLDYAGFKLKVLMHGGPKDWSMATAVSRNASADWSAIKARVTDQGLKDAMDVAIDGMRQATASGNAGMAGFAADVDLALVDLLEGHFEAARR